MANHNYKDYYSRGSEALKVNQSYQREVELERPVPARRKKNNKRVVSRRYIEKHKAINKLNLKSKLLIMMLGTYFFIIGLFCISLNVNNSDMTIQLNSLKTEVNENYSKIEDLEMQLAQSYDLKTIEQYAKNKLDMNKPLPEQIISIQLVNENYTEYFQPEKKATIWEKVKGVFNG